MDFVDEEDRLLALGERRDDRLEALFEIAAEAGARQQRAGIEGEDLGALQRLLNVVEPMTRRSPAVRIGLIIVARSMVPPDTAPAPTVE